MCWCMLALPLVLDKAVTAAGYYLSQFCDRLTFDLIQTDPVFSKLRALPIGATPSSFLPLWLPKEGINRSWPYLGFSLLTGMVTMGGRALERSFSSLMEFSASISPQRRLLMAVKLLLNSLSTLG